MNELLTIPTGDLHHVDIARMNLLCAVGLPGAEDLDVEEYLQRVDHWAARIARMTDRAMPAFRRDPAKFDHSEPYWRMLMLTSTLHHEYGLQYNPTQRDPEDWTWTDSRDQFIHGLLGATRMGTCSSMPILVIAVGRRLGYPLYEVHAPGHVFCRWDGQVGEGHPNPAWQERFNIEYSGDGMDRRTDESYYERPRPWPPGLIETEKLRAVKWYLRSLTPAEELAACLAQRAWTFEANGKLRQAWDSLAVACRVAPHHDGYAIWARRIHEKQVEQSLKPFNLTPRQYLAMVESRLRGAAVTFPWEQVSQSHRTVPPRPVHPFDDALAAVAWAMIDQRPDLMPLAMAHAPLTANALRAVMQTASVPTTPPRLQPARQNRPTITWTTN